MSLDGSLNSPRNQSCNKLRWLIYAVACSVLLILTSAVVAQHSTLSFGSYWASGRAMHFGQNPYGVYPETFRSNFTFFGGPASFPDVNLNPPCLLPLFYLMSNLTLVHFAVVWTICSALCGDRRTTGLVHPGDQELPDTVAALFRPGNRRCCGGGRFTEHCSSWRRLRGSCTGEGKSMRLPSRSD